MGGETSPWGIAWARRGRPPEILTVPEPRNRDLVAAMVAEFAPVLLTHLLQPSYDARRFGSASPPPPRQVWLPNPTHLDTLQHLAYTYRRAQKGDPERIALLNGLGRAAGWLFREAQRPHQLGVMDATQVLRSAYEFPADDVRQQHLGYLLAWLTTPGDREARLDAASAAERHSVATTLEPEIERVRLQPAVEQWNIATKDADLATANVAAERVRRVLAEELTRRIVLLDRALAMLDAEERIENPGVTMLEDRSRHEHLSDYLVYEYDGPIQYRDPSPETDNRPDAAARRFHKIEASAEVGRGALLHHDEDLLEETIAAGDGFRGEVTVVQDEGTGRKTVPVWSIRVDGTGPLRLREGSKVAVFGIPKRTGVIRDVEETPGGSRSIDVEITNWKRANRVDSGPVLAADDQRLVGTQVAFVPQSDDFFADSRQYRVGRKDGPGAWLTHA